MLLTIDDITCRFGETVAVDGVSLSIEAGEIVCLLGPSGCGKTTLLRLVAGLETLAAGDIRYEGESVVGVPPHLRAFGMMFQNYALFPHLNVFDNVAYGLKQQGMRGAALDERVDEMLALVDLDGFGKREIGRLSGGEQQRVALARALAPGPRLLMLDEPLGALDRALRERLMLELRTILKRVGVTALYVTHDQAEAFAVADRIVVMNAGRLAQVDTPARLYATPRTPFVARFLGFNNVLEGRVTEQGEIETAIGNLKSAESFGASADPVTILIKPDGIRIEPHADDVNTIVGTVMATSFRGRYQDVWLLVNNVTLTFEAPPHVLFEHGKDVAFAIEPGAVLNLTK